METTTTNAPETIGTTVTLNYTKAVTAPDPVKEALKEFCNSFSSLSKTLELKVDNINKKKTYFEELKQMVQPISNLISAAIFYKAIDEADIKHIKDTLNGIEKISNLEVKNSWSWS